MANNSISFDLPIEAFRSEILRWNRQINLVSRQETEGRLDGLFKQCVGGHEALLEHLSSDPIVQTNNGAFYYFDLGSGGGLPGVIWHFLFAKAFGPVNSFMVEPRDKRAWFLDRMTRIPEMPHFSTLCGRWGEVSIFEDVNQSLKRGPGHIVISLKALNLDDVAIINGLIAAFQGTAEGLKGSQLVLARYYPPDQTFDDKTTSLLKISAPGEFLDILGHKFVSQGGRVVPIGPSGAGLASLVLSSYLITV